MELTFLLNLVHKYHFVSDSTEAYQAYAHIHTSGYVGTEMTEMCEWTEVTDDRSAGWVINGWLKNAQWDREDRKKKLTEWCNEQDNKA